MRLVHFVVGLLSFLPPINSVLANGTEYPALLGNGYDPLKLQHKMSQCIDGTVVERSNIEYVAEFTKVESWNQLQTQMNFSVPGSIVLNSESEFAKFVLRAWDTQFTSTYILQNHVGIRQKFITKAKLANLETDPVRFREECGTQFISMTTSGGKLHVGIKFSFSDFEFKQEFDASGAIKSMTGLGAHVDSLSMNAKKNSSVEIFFHQVGGNLSELNNMFESGDIVSCSLEHFDKCENLLKAIWNYSKDRFAKSVLEGKDQTISFQSEEYPNTPRVYENPLIKKERAKLLDALDQQHYERDFLYSLKWGRLEGYENCDDRCLTRLLSDVMSNMMTLRDSIRLSFESPELFLETGTINKLELHKIQTPVKKQNYYRLLAYMPYAVPTAFGTSLLTYFIRWTWAAQGRAALN